MASSRWVTGPRRVGGASPRAPRPSLCVVRPCLGSRHLASPGLLRGAGQSGGRAAGTCRPLRGAVSQLMGSSQSHVVGRGHDSRRLGGDLGGTLWVRRHGPGARGHEVCGPQAVLTAPIRPAGASSPCQCRGWQGRSHVACPVQGPSLVDGSLVSMPWGSHGEGASSGAFVLSRPPAPQGATPQPCSAVTHLPSQYWALGGWSPGLGLWSLLAPRGWVRVCCFAD